MSKRARKIYLIAAGIILLFVSFVYGMSFVKWFHFKSKDSLREWREKVFKGRVLYTVKIEKTDGYLAAYSKGAASGIFYNLVFNPRVTPMVSWKWRVLKFPAKKEREGSRWIEQDDYAARFYVIFPSIFFTHTKCLEYVWDKDLPEGVIMTSPYFRNIKIIVAESGEKSKEEWIFEERNIVEDFKKAFGKNPGKVGAIAIMTDTDNTISTAEANYDEIKVGYVDEKK